jgi:hypothetical protein
VDLASLRRTEEVERGEMRQFQPIAEEERGFLAAVGEINAVVFVGKRGNGNLRRSKLVREWAVIARAQNGWGMLRGGGGTE